MDESAAITQGPVVVFRWRNAPGWPVEYASPNAAEVFGHSAEEFVRGDVAYADLIAPSCLERVAREVTEASESGVSSFVHEPYEVHHRDGGSRWLYDATKIERDAEGRATHYVGYVIDVTDRVLAEREKRELEARLLHAQKLESLGVLAGGVAHDFNNLLTAILGHASLALGQLEDGPRGARGHVEQIERLATQAAELTRQLLAYSGRGTFVVRPTDLGEVVREMASMLEVVVSKKAHLDFRCDDALPAVMADRAQLQQIVMNLITNASDAFGGEPGTITVRVRTRPLLGETIAREFPGWPLEPGTHVSLSVSDDGMGMDEDTLRRLFDPFFTTKVDGRGLGMSAVLGIVRGHRGGLRVTSQPRRGATFEIVLPATEQAVEAPAPKAEPAAVWRGRGTVLVVDDQDPVRKVARELVELLGFRTIGAEDGASALERYRQHRDDIVLVLLDVSMPVMDGEETLDSLRRIDPSVRVVMTSGYAEGEGPLRGGLARAAGFLQKPYGIADLRRVLRATLGEPLPADP